MKGGIAAAALAAMATGATAINHRHAHQMFKRGEAEVCTPGCTTIYTTITGEPTLCPPPPPPTTSVKPTPSTTETPKPTTPTTTETPKLPVPTPEPITCPTPGTYTFTATTVTLEETTTVCVGTSTHVVPGTHTVGGVTTIVEEATTVTCPVATHTTQPDGKVIETIVETEYVCPTAGTYTIAPITTTVTEECDIEYPVPTSYNPGTYTAPEQVITVTDTNFVTVCPYTSSEAPKPTSHPPPPPPAPKPTVEAPKPKPSPPKEQPKPEKPEKPSNGGGHFDGSFGAKGDHFGVTYTPYDETTGDCKSSSQVEKDIAEIKNDGFEVVRVYSTDCDTLPSVGSACKKHGLEMLIGIFVKETGCSANTPEIKEQIDAISQWGQWDIVKLLIVGNESVMNGFCTPDELASLIKTVKGQFSEYNGPVTVAETLAQWLDPRTSGALCDVVDYVGANIHPFFNEQNLAKLAGKFVKGQLAILDSICSGKEAVNLECGWPLEGDCMGNACPGSEAQSEALSSIREECGDRSVFFSYTSDGWKEPGEYNVEQHWGCKDYFSLF